MANPGVDFQWHVAMNKLPKIAASMRTKADLIVTKTALDLEAQWKTRVPVDTGTLKNSVQATRVGHAHWRVLVGAHYGIYVNYGTRFMAARPFYEPGIAAVRPQFMAAMKAIAL